MLFYVKFPLNRCITRLWVTILTIFMINFVSNSFFVKYKFCKQKILIQKYLMKITPQLIKFFEFYIMGPTEINLYGIAHVKVDIIAGQKMYIIQPV